MKNVSYNSLNWNTFLKDVNFHQFEKRKLHVIEKVNREFKQITTAGAATAIVVEEVWGGYVAVARQNTTRNTNSTAEKLKPMLLLN